MRGTETGLSGVPRETNVFRRIATAGNVRIFLESLELVEIGYNLWRGLRRNCSRVWWLTERIKENEGCCSIRAHLLTGRSILRKVRGSCTVSERAFNEAIERRRKRRGERQDLESSKQFGTQRNFAALRRPCG